MPEDGADGALPGIGMLDDEVDRASGVGCGKRSSAVTVVSLAMV